jgi:ribosomal protein L33
MAYKFGEQTIWDLRNINIECQCGRRSNYVIFQDPQDPDKKEMALYCDACGYKGDIAPLVHFIPFPDAPWRRV